MEMRQKGYNFSIAIRLNRVTSKNADYIFEELFIYIWIIPG